MATISALDWDNFYHTLGRGEFLSALRDQMKLQYDYALIDSRSRFENLPSGMTVAQRRACSR